MLDRVQPRSVEIPYPQLNGQLHPVEIKPLCSLMQSNGGEKNRRKKEREQEGENREQKMNIARKRMKKGKEETRKKESFLPVCICDM